MLYIIPILCTVKTPPHWVVDTCLAQDENRPQLLPWVSSRWFVCGCNTLFSEQTGFSRFKWFSRANPLLRAVPRVNQHLLRRDQQLRSLLRRHLLKLQFLLKSVRNHFQKILHGRNLRKKVLFLRTLRSRSLPKGTHRRRDLHIPSVLIRRIFRE